MKPIIETKKLNVTYFKGQENEIRALKNIDIQIYPGEFVIFYGPSGCGKSTILYSIAGLERHMEGEITINGVNYMDFSEKDFEKLEFQVLFSEKFDDKNAIISIHAGAGGVDAQDWAQILERMFLLKSLGSSGTAGLAFFISSSIFFTFMFLLVFSSPDIQSE